MDDRERYEILRKLTTPVVALTCRRGDRLNGMIANSTIRASLVPDRLRVATYVFKHHLSHDFIAATGRYVLHLLDRSQWEVVRALGFRSGSEGEKLAELDHRIAEESGLPVLEGTVAWMECEVVNAMDAGPSTFFMGQIRRMERGPGEAVMDSEWFRENIPEEWRETYLRNLEEAQRVAREWDREMDDRWWRELHERARRAATSAD